MILGGSDVEMSDLQSFAALFDLRFNPPQMVLVGPDPGFTSSQGEGEGDIQGVASVVPNATIIFVYGKNLLTVTQYAVDQNIAPVFTASSPQVTGVGGAAFNEGAGHYWSASNSPTGESVLSYIPEMAWNDSLSQGELEAAGGGASVLYPKPIWQTGLGVPNDGARDVPDVSMAASAVHDAHVGYYQGAPNYYDGGTSVASPLFAEPIPRGARAAAGAGAR